ncbi:MAG: GTP cyclohydrolase II [Chloroflexi bacterium]|nr:GTP cyclohydrolase II [Chloroflexota bacterium]
MSRMRVEKITCSRIPTEQGVFQLCYYRNNQDNKEHLALILGDISRESDPLVRIHSECFTGDVLGSLRCDCGPQLQQAMQQIAAAGSGIIIYLRQEGRGIGLLDKLRAYNLQDMGYDTVEANLLLGHQADGRDYTAAALILQDLGVRSLRLLTNNPAKIAGLEAHGLRVSQRIPLTVPPNRENAAYLQTKVARMHHLLETESVSLPIAPPSNGQSGRHGRPFITLSYAQSLDGSITAQRGQPLALSGAESLRLTHQIRADHDAILVGIGTALADDPSLTVRLVDGRQPQPIIVDSHLRTPLTAKLLRHPRPPLIAATDAADFRRAAALAEAGATVLRLPAAPDGRVQLPALLHQLYDRGIRSVMVEGGAQIITSFLAAHLVDRLALTVAPLFVGGLNAVANLPVNGHGFPRLHNVQTQQVGQDMVLFGDVSFEG